MHNSELRLHMDCAFHNPFFFSHMGYTNTISIFTVSTIIYIHIHIYVLEHTYIIYTHLLMYLYLF